MKRALKVMLVIVLSVAILAIGFLIFYLSITKDLHLQEEKLSLSETCVTIFDGNGEEIQTPRSYESLSSLSKYTTDAFVAVEDKRFYEHNGLDYMRIAKAALKNIASFSLKEGASTISQQLIKNTHLSGEKTFTRKLKEMKLTRELENNYSKEQILELYLNSIYFGHSAFGIGNAAKFYFGTEAENLTPAQSAMLAGLVKSPNNYSPFRDEKKCLARRNLVIDLMAEQGSLTEDEAKKAKEEALPKEPCEKKKTNSYLTLVYEEIQTLFPDLNAEKRLNVYTSYVPELQKEIQSFDVDCDICGMVRSEYGGIKAFYSTCGSLRRQPASTIKPLAVYAPALEEGMISPATPILDEKVNFSGYSPSNYGGTYSGYISVRDALSKSVNIPAVKILNELGVQKAAGYLSKMNLPCEQDDLSLALALGGMKNGFTLKEISDAYAVFATGSYQQSNTIDKVEENGKIIYKRDEKKTHVFSGDVCYLISDMLQTVVKEGTAKKLKNLPYPVCAKTGTNADSKGNLDAYTIAYTQNDVVSVWLGNKDNARIAYTGGGLPANFASRILNKLYNDHAPESFLAPSDNIVEAALDKEEYDENHKMVLADPLAPSYLTKRDLFLKSSLPHDKSERFSAPTIEKPSIYIKNGAVCIELCVTYYYDYVVKRECDGQKKEIYRGKYRDYLFDNSIQQGKTYTYYITPLWGDIEGKTVKLPSVYIPQTSLNLEDFESG